MAFGKGRAVPLKPQGPKTEGDDQRWSVRRPTQAPGLVFPGGIAASIPCIVADQSASGAALRVQSGWINPFRGQSSLGQTFKLVLRLDRVEVECEIVRIEGEQIGVRFTSVMKPIMRKI